MEIHLILMVFSRKGGDFHGLLLLVSGRVDVFCVRLRFLFADLLFQLKGAERKCQVFAHIADLGSSCLCEVQFTE